MTTIESPTSVKVGPPAPTQPAPIPTRSTPSQLTVPNLDDGSATASAALHQVATYVDVLAQARTTPEAYGKLVQRGFLDSAIALAAYSQGIVEYDKVGDNDAFAGMVAGSVVDALNAVKRMSIDTDIVELGAELTTARDAASNLARGLELLVARQA